MLPVSTADAKAQALGGIGLGLMGLSLTPTDPASAASLAIPSITFTLASSWVDVREGESPGSAQGTRFPVIGVSYPVKAVGCCNADLRRGCSTSVGKRSGKVSWPSRRPRPK